ncbi:21133_t:CDS:2, partial [Entrophospora sp. SA101]
EEFNGKEKKLYRSSGKYFENREITTWSIDSFLDYLDNNKGRSHKFPLIVKKEIFTSWLENKLESGNISSQVYLNLLRETKKMAFGCDSCLDSIHSPRSRILRCVEITTTSLKKSEGTPSKSLVKTGKACDNYINFDDYAEKNITKKMEISLRIEINKDISLYDEPGYIYIYKVSNKEKKMNHLYKIGRTKSVDRRLEQWEKKCHYKAELIKALPDDKKCKYTHCTERLIHLELEVHRVDLSCGVFNSGEMGVLRREGLRI